SRPFNFKKEINLLREIEDLGFLSNLRGDDGYISFDHPELIIEFLVLDKGRGSSKPFEINKLNINAQSLRYLNIYDGETIDVYFEGLIVRVPTPWSFAIHKLLVSTKRKDIGKSQNDINQSINMIN
ncbi:MAG: GSU2403 family nucleotidyltransferase fold protein, partial [Thermodesulfobacteriota bacterium]